MKKDREAILSCRNLLKVPAFSQSPNRQRSHHDQILLACTQVQYNESENVSHMHARTHKSEQVCKVGME